MLLLEFARAALIATVRMTQVLFVGPKLPQRDQIKLHFALRVRRAKVKAALEWLIENNVLYKRKFEDKELRISQENLDLYPEDDVPEPVIQHMIVRELDSKTAAKDTSGYTRGDQDADAESDDEEMETEDKEERKDAPKDATGARWRHTGLADVNAHGISPGLLAEIVDERENSQKSHKPGKGSGGEKEKKTEPVLIVPSASSVRMVDKCSPEVFPGAFPTLFPYGIGGPAQPRRTRISLSNFATHCMRLADRRFSTHPPFVFTLFNLVQQLRVSRSASRSLRAGYFLDFSRDLVHLSTQAIKQCIKDLKGAERRGKYPTLQHCKDKKTRKALLAMFRHVNTIGGRLPLTDASKRNARHEAVGIDIKLGMPDFFITVNPEDRHSPLVCHYAGVSVPLKLTDHDLPPGCPRARSASASWPMTRWQPFTFPTHSCAPLSTPCSVFRLAGCLRLISRSGCLVTSLRTTSTPKNRGAAACTITAWSGWVTSPTPKPSASSCTRPSFSNAFCTTCRAPSSRKSPCSGPRTSSGSRFRWLPGSASRV